MNDRIDKSSSDTKGFLAEEIITLINEHRTVLQIISQDKKLFQEYKTALSAAKRSTPEGIHLAKSQGDK